MEFKASKEMKINLSQEQAKMLSTKEDIKKIIAENPDTVMAYDIWDDNDLIGFVLVYEYETHKYFLWEYAIDQNYQGIHKGTEALKEFISLLKDKYEASTMTTTYLFGNDVAKHVYEKVGFIETDVIDEEDCHEVNMIYHLK